MNPKKKLKEFYDHCISLKAEPKEIAFGAAIGVFIGVTPTIPFHTVLIILLCLLLKQNITTGILSACIISNPVTIPFFYAAEYHLGKLILQDNNCRIVLNDYSIREIINMGWNVAYPLLVGGTVLAFLFAIPAYFIAHRTVIVIRKRNGETEHYPDQNYE